jgi:hypothetical protein
MSIAIPHTILQDIKNFDWQRIIDYANSLGDLNDAQLRFVKGMAIEIAIEQCADGDLTYVGAKHKDYDWPKHNITAELKSQMSQSMYKRVKGGGHTLKENFSIKLNNSNGTNKHLVLDPVHVADYVLVVRSDGVFVLDKATVLANSTSGGDGFTVNVTKNDVVEITGRMTQHTKLDINIKDEILAVIRNSIPSATPQDVLSMLAHKHTEWVIELMYEMVSHTIPKNSCCM